MKTTIRNFEIENYFNIVGNEKSFRNNIDIKIPYDMDWALRINLKTMSTRYELVQEARKEIEKDFVDNNKVEEDGTRVKPEFLQEFNERINGLMFQSNELEFIPIKKADFKDLPLSMPERDFLMIMVDEEAEKESEKEE